MRVWCLHNYRHRNNNALCKCNSKNTTESLHKVFSSIHNATCCTCLMGNFFTKTNPVATVELNIRLKLRCAFIICYRCQWCKQFYETVVSCKSYFSMESITNLNISFSIYILILFLSASFFF